MHKQLLTKRLRLEMTAVFLLMEMLLPYGHLLGLFALEIELWSTAVTALHFKGFEEDG